MKEYEAIEDFESPEYGPVSKGMILILDAAAARAWRSAGLVREPRPKRDAGLKDGKEVKGDG